MSAVPEEAFALPPVRTRDLLFGSGPRLARDAMGPMLVFYLGWRLAGLVAGIVAATAVSLLALRHEHRQGRRGLMARIALGFVVLQAVVGLVTGSERLYLAQPVLVTGGYGLAFLGSVLVRRPLSAAFAEEMYPFPDEVRRSITYRRAFGRISLVWGVYLVGRSLLGWPHSPVRRSRPSWPSTSSPEYPSPPCYWPGRSATPSASSAAARSGATPSACSTRRPPPPAPSSRRPRGPRPGGTGRSRARAPVR